MRWFWQPIPDEDIPTYRGIGMSLVKGTVNIKSPEQAKRVLRMLRGEIPIPKGEQNKTVPERNTASTGDMFVREEGENFEDFTKRAWRVAAQEVKGESIARDRRALRHRRR